MQRGDFCYFIVAIANNKTGCNDINMIKNLLLSFPFRFISLLYLCRSHEGKSARWKIRLENSYAIGENGGSV